ncbi:MAG: phospho-N-acetylmuramoyl-pentapeptide-transferase [Candidatus Moduliflexus flocculans]|nr:phospho-N-acetylmuramoyl-pentapeptide-transferase [Candidatus Moduliflexus flocculans]
MLGAVDDWEGIRGKRKRRRHARPHQVPRPGRAGAGHRLCLEIYAGRARHCTCRAIRVRSNSAGWYVPIAAFIIVGESNAVNFTDGLDGLAGLISATAFAAYGGIALMQGQIFLARFCFTVVGALFGFLWFNVHPAQLFMGDTGSLALGATLAVVALMTGQWALLLLIAIIPFSEALSVVIQIAYFKLTKGKRFFKMAPIHLHFELLGWSETQVVQRFWLIGLLAAMLGIGLALV